MNDKVVVYAGDNDVLDVQYRDLFGVPAVPGDSMTLRGVRWVLDPDRRWYQDPIRPIRFGRRP